MINLSSSVEQSLDIGQNSREQNRILTGEIQNLFLDIAKRIDDKSLNALNKFIPIDEIIYEIGDTEPILLIQYVKQITFYLSKTKMELEEKIQRSPEVDDQNNYESLIQKLEADVRQHIRIEQQQRLHIENLQQQLDETLLLNEEKDEEITQKDQELRSLILRTQEMDTRAKNNNNNALRDTAQNGHKSQDLIVKNLNNVQKVNQTNYINNIHFQPRQNPPNNHDSSAPSLMPHNVSNGNVVDKLNDMIISNDLHKSQSKKSKSINNNGTQQLPLQLKALFNKVYNDRDLNSSQSKSQQSKRNIQRIQSTKLKAHNETTYKDDNQSKNFDSQENSQAAQKRTQSYHGQKDGSVSHRNKISTNVTRNLESQFIETDRMREELLKQFGQAQYYNFHVGNRENIKKGDKSQTNDQSYTKKDHVIQKTSILDKKEYAKQELSKSSSFDGAANKMVRQYRREIKSQAQPIATSQRSTQNIGNYIKKKTIQ